MSALAGPVNGTRPEVSVLLATYGRPELLGRALRSLAEQTLDASRFEVLVIVNGPPGDTPEVVAASRAEHPGANMRVLVSEKPGVAHARTLGLWAARGDHFTILDDDDWFSPTFLEDLLEHVSPGVIPLAWMADIYDERPDEPSFENYFSTALERHRGETVPALSLPQAISLNVCKLMPVDAARAVPYDESLHGGSDFVFWTKMFARDQFRFRVIQDQHGGLLPHTGPRVALAPRPRLRLRGQLAARLHRLARRAPDAGSRGRADGPPHGLGPVRAHQPLPRRPPRGAGRGGGRHRGTRPGADGLARGQPRPGP